MAVEAVENPKKARKIPAVKKLIEYMDMLNVADALDEDTLREIGRVTEEEFCIDKESRREYEDQMEKAEEFVELLMKKKDFPFEGASNAIYPLLSEAALQFNARSLPLLIKNQRAVKCRVNGPDPQGQKAKIADLVSEHMSWQLTEEMEDWIGEMDAALIALPVYGCIFKKIYRDIPNQRNVSEYYSPMDIVINYKARSLSKAKRISHIFELSGREIKQRQLQGLYLDIDLGHGDSEAKTGDVREKDPSFVMIEQHRWYDLDGDGLEEPWIVTIHKDSCKVVRIRPRFDVGGIILTNNEKKIAQIEPIQYFVKYEFMPSFNRNIYGYGFGKLLLHPNSVINSLLNQIIDSGTWYNTNAGIASADIGLGKGEQRFAPNELKISTQTHEDIRNKILMLPAREPSNTLFQILGLLIQSFERLSNSTDVLTGEHSTANQPASTTLALIEQGLKFYKAASNRLFKSLRDELRLLFNLNAKYMPSTQEQFFRLFEDEGMEISGAAYNVESLDVTPVAATEEITIVEKLIKAEQAIQMMQQMGLPWQYMREGYKRYYEALGQEDIDSILPPPDWQPPSDPEAEIKAGELEIESRQQDNEDTRVGMDLQKLPYEILKMKADIKKTLEDIKDKAATTEITGAVKLADAETKRMKVQQDQNANATPQNINPQQPQQAQPQPNNNPQGGMNDNSNQG